MGRALADRVGHRATWDPRSVGVARRGAGLPAMAPHEVRGVARVSDLGVDCPTVAEPALDCRVPGAHRHFHRRVDVRLVCDVRTPQPGDRLRRRGWAGAEQRATGTLRAAVRSGIRTVDLHAAVRLGASRHVVCPSRAGASDGRMLVRGRGGSVPRRRHASLHVVGRFERAGAIPRPGRPARRAVHRRRHRPDARDRPVARSWV